MSTPFDVTNGRSFLGEAGRLSLGVPFLKLSLSAHAQNQPNTPKTRTTS
jgi:hypothetical protein